MINSKDPPTVEKRVTPLREWKPNRTNPYNEFIATKYNRERIERMLNHICPSMDPTPTYRRPPTKKLKESHGSQYNGDNKGDRETESMSPVDAKTFSWVKEAVSLQSSSVEHADGSTPETLGNIDDNVKASDTSSKAGVENDLSQNKIELPVDTKTFSWVKEACSLKSSSVEHADGSTPETLDNISDNVKSSDASSKPSVENDLSQNKIKLPVDTMSFSWVKEACPLQSSSVEHTDGLTAENLCNADDNVKSSDASFKAGVENDLSRNNMLPLETMSFSWVKEACPLQSSSVEHTDGLTTELCNTDGNVKPRDVLSKPGSTTVDDETTNSMEKERRDQNNKTSDLQMVGSMHRTGDENHTHSYRPTTAPNINTEKPDIFIKSRYRPTTAPYSIRANITDNPTINELRGRLERIRSSFRLSRGHNYLERQRRNMPNLMDSIQSEDEVTVIQNEKPRSPMGVDDFDNGLNEASCIKSSSYIDSEAVWQKSSSFIDSEAVWQKGTLTTSSVSSQDDFLFNQTFSTDENEKTCCLANNSLVPQLRTRLRRMEDDFQGAKSRLNNIEKGFQERNICAQYTM